MNELSLSDLKQHPRVLELYRSRLRLKQQGKRWRGLCLFHDDRKADNFDVFQHENTYVYKCQACGASGSILDLIQKTDGTDLRGAIKIVRDFCSDFKQKTRLAEETFKRTGGSEAAKSFKLEDYRKYEIALAENSFVQNWLQHERGISYETARKLSFGFAQDISHVTGPNEPLAAKGWISMPAIEDERVVAVEFRSIITKTFRRKLNMEGQIIYGISDIDALSPVFLTEGNFDRAVLSQAGLVACSLPNATTTPSAEQKDRLLDAEYLVLAGDTDDAGTKAMERLWIDMKERTFLLRWPAGVKDANEMFLKICGADVAKFRSEVNKLVDAAKIRPMQGIYSVQDSLINSDHAQIADNPDRFQMPWKSIQEMALILPGTITTIYSTESGTGKTNLVIQATIYHAQKTGEVVLNYQAEMSPRQIDTMFASHLTRKDRLKLTTDDYRMAGSLLGGDFKYYIGRNTSLTNMTEVLDLIEAGVRRFGAKVVVLDNLHFLCRSEADTVKAQAAAMQRITNMTATYGLKFILVHQARKADQQHKRKVTHVSDLDGSKAVQNDSTTIFSLHRDEVKYSKDDPGKENEYDPVTQVRLQKARDKGEGKAYTQLMFNGSICTFEDISYTKPFEEPAKAESIFG